jgi:peptide chain release factor 3
MTKRAEHAEQQSDPDMVQAEMPELVGETLWKSTRDEIDLLDAAGEDFDVEAFREGKITPVFWGRPSQ